MSEAKPALSSRKEKRKAIARAKREGSKTIVRPKPHDDREDLTKRVLKGDKVCRQNAFTYKDKKTILPTRKFRTYTVSETDISGRWFRVEGDTKWHNANSFMLLEQAETEIQKMVNKVMLNSSDSANTGDTESDEK